MGNPKRSAIGGLVLVCVLVLLLLPSVGQAQSVNCATQSLQAAINAAGTGATLLVSGTCNENVFIGENKERITLDGGNTAMISGLPANSATSATIQITGSGIIIKNFSSITGGRDGILVNRGGAAIITNNTIQGNNRNGVNVNENSSARIGFQSVFDPAPSPNTIQNNSGRGVSVNRSANARIVGNTISNNGDDGVGVFSVSHADVAKNLINGNGTGPNGGDGIAVGRNSGVNLGSDTTVTFFDEPNTTTVNNVGGFGIRCVTNSYADGRLGTLNGISGATSFSGSCSNSLIP